MVVALIILGAMVAAGLPLYLMEQRYQAKHRNEPDAEVAAPAAAESECCGLHITCEKDSLMAAVSREIEYYDDEELDAYRGTNAEAYTDDAIEEFRDIMLTLRPEEIAPWARSIQLRGIELPAPVREELVMIVAEARQNKAIV